MLLERRQKITSCRKRIKICTIIQRISAIVLLIFFVFVLMDVGSFDYCAFYNAQEPDGLMPTFIRHSIGLAVSGIIITICDKIIDRARKTISDIRRKYRK